MAWNTCGESAVYAPAGKRPTVKRRPVHDTNDTQHASVRRSAGRIVAPYYGALRRRGPGVTCGTPGPYGAGVTRVVRVPAHIFVQLVAHWQVCHGPRPQHENPNLFQDAGQFPCAWVHLPGLAGQRRLPPNTCTTGRSYFTRRRRESSEPSCEQAGALGCPSKSGHDCMQHLSAATCAAKSKHMSV